MEKMDKVIVYGLGKMFHIYRKLIESNYDVVGYCDKNESKLPSNGIKMSELQEVMKICDYILVTSATNAPEITKELNLRGIKNDRIKIWAHEELSHCLWGIEPQAGSTYAGGWEDLVVASLCKELGLDITKLKYIELGVNDPISGNNTYYFYKRGSNGILVEANPYYFDTIKKVRKRDIIINKAIYAGEEKHVKFYISTRPGLSSLIDNHIRKNEAWSVYDISEEVEVPTVNINDVFEQLGSDCDLMSIDLEGYDLEALKSINFEKNRPKVIIVELNYSDVANQDYYKKIVNLLINIGYVLYAHNIYNGIFYDGFYVIE